MLAILQGYYPAKPITEVVNMGRDFLDMFEHEFDMFVKASKKDIITAIASAPDEWLEAFIAPGISVRNYILDQLTISN